MAARGAVLVLLTLLPRAGAMYGSAALTIPSYAIGNMYDFSFLAGGTASASLTVAPAAPPAGAFVALLLCDDAALDADVLSFLSVHDLCAALASGEHRACAAQLLVPAGGNASIAALPIAARATLHFIYAGCSPAATLAARASWHNVNPGGEELPAGYIPLKPLTVTLGGIWAALLGALLLHFAAVSAAFSPPPSWAAAARAAAAGRGDAALREPQLSAAIRPLHVALLAAPALFCAAGFVGSAYWSRVSRTGLDNAALRAADAAARDAAGGALVALVVALARGWQVTRLRLGTAECREAAALVALYVLSWSAWQALQSIVSLFLLVLTYSLLFRYVFASASLSVRLLGVFNAVAGALRARAPEDEAAAARPRGGPTAYTPLNDGAGDAQGPARARWWPFAAAAPGPRAFTSADAPEPADGDGGGGGDGGAGGGDGFDEAAAAITDGGLSARQLAFMRVFRVAAAGFITLDVLAELSTDVLASADVAPWIGASLRAAAALGMWGALAIAFRARADPAKSLLFDPRGYLSAPSLAVALLDAEAGDAGGGGGGGGARGGVRDGVRDDWAGGDGYDDGGDAARAAQLLSASTASAARARGGRDADHTVIINSGAAGGGVLAEPLAAGRADDGDAARLGYSRAQ